MIDMLLFILFFSIFSWLGFIVPGERAPALFSKRPSPLATFGVTSVESQDASASSDPVAPGTNDLVFYWSCASGTGTFNCRTLSNFGPGTWILQSLSFEFVT